MATKQATAGTELDTEKVNQPIHWTCYGLCNWWTFAPEQASGSIAISIGTDRYLINNQKIGNRCNKYDRSYAACAWMCICEGVVATRLRMCMYVCIEPECVSGAGSAQLVERLTEKPGAVLTRVRGPVRQGIFLSESTFSADSLTVSVQPPCAI